MSKLAARMTDKHVCPMPFHMVVPNFIVVGNPTVLIGGQPAACAGDLTTCGAPIAMGSSTVLIGGKPAARMGDTTAHGGSIVSGCPTVLVGG